KAFCWHRPVHRTLYPYLFSMEDRIWPTLSGDKLTYIHMTSVLEQVAFLNTMPPGRRCLKQNWVHNEVFSYIGDRIPPEGLSPPDISEEPVKTGYLYLNAIGGDSLPSGYSNVLLDGFAQAAFTWGQNQALVLRDAGTTVDFLSFDAE